MDNQGATNLPAGWCGPYQADSHKRCPVRKGVCTHQQVEAGGVRHERLVGAREGQIAQHAARAHGPREALVRCAAIAEQAARLPPPPLIRQWNRSVLACSSITGRAPPTTIPD